MTSARPTSPMLVSIDDTSARPIGPVVDEQTPARSAAQRLRNVVRLNAATSLLGGVAAAGAAGPVADLLGTGHAGWVRLAGIGLGLFAIDVGMVAGARLSRLLFWTPAITALDLVWVAASVTTIAAGWYSTAGSVVVAVVALAVAGFALGQALTRRRACALAPLGRVGVDEAPPTEVVHVESLIEGDAATAWRVITDHDLYGRLAPNLSKVGATSSDGPELTRVCANRRGVEWTESCTSWVDGRRFEVAVDTSDYPYPLTEMRGAWWVEPVGDRTSRVGMDFRFRPDRGVVGRLFAAVMHAAFPLVLGRIIRGWRREIRSLSR